MYSLDEGEVLARDVLEVLDGVRAASELVIGVVFGHHAAGDSKVAQLHLGSSLKPLQPLREVEFLALVSVVWGRERERW